MKDIKVGEYIRTTYGIGKIVDMGISYTDDNYLWHIDYITDNKNICISIAPEKPIKTNNKSLYETYETMDIDIIDKVLKDKYEIICYKPSFFEEEYNPYKFIPRGNCELYDNHKFIKHSSNIIDLIEVRRLCEWA